MNKKRPVIKRVSTLSITPPLEKMLPMWSALKALLRAVKKRAPNGATKAIKHVITNKWMEIGDATN